MIGLTDMNGNVSAQYTYDAFGNQLSDNTTNTNPFRYCGEYYDAETNNIYLRAGYYDTATGRFISEDPVKDGLNWYNYCAGNPVMFMDPTGEDAIVITNEYGVASNDYVGSGNGYFGHMAVIVQDQDGTWYYFSCGDQYAKIIEAPDWALDSLDNFNYWLSSYSAEYTKATYIKGDFSDSYSYFNECSKDAQNESYNFLTNNCSQVVIKGLRKGTLQDGTSVSSFMGWGYNAVPNITAKELEDCFANNKFTYQESHKQINDMLWEITEGAWYKRNYFLGKRLEKLW